MNLEIKEIPGCPKYGASCDGRIWSQKWMKTGAPWREMKTWPDKKGYIKLRLSIGGKTYNRYVHRLILETFVGPCPEGMEACHLNHDKTDNCLRNLQWGTAWQNSRARAKSNRAASGELNGQSRLTAEQVKLIRSLSEDGSVPQKELAHQFGVSSRTISSIVTRTTWKGV